MEQKLYVAEHRRDRGWDQDDLAKASKLDKSTISRVETTGKARIDTLKAIAAALGKSVSDLRRAPFPGEYSDTPHTPIAAPTSFEEFLATVKSVRFRSTLSAEERDRLAHEILRDLYDER